MTANNAYQELKSVEYTTFPEIQQKIKELSTKYGDLPTGNFIRSFTRAGLMNYTDNPYEQNARIKKISSFPGDYKKSDVERMLKNVYSNEQPLRQIHHALEYTAYPLLHTRFLYQNLLTYHSYVAPYLTNEGDSKKDEFWREWKLLEKLRTEFNVKSVTHEIVGQCLQEGKVFYYPRYSVDKAHNKVNHAFMQQLPSDWVKIVGYNNKSKYTLAFDMMYFTEPATDVRQFGDLFLPYLDTFNMAVYPAPKGVGTKLVYASDSRINLNEVPENQNIDAYYQNGRWFYWVTLPIDKVFTFEIDDVTRTAVSPFTGLIMDMLQLAQLENLALELLSNPLIAVLTGEIPYFDNKDTNIADQYKLSPTGLTMFNVLWDQLMARTNIGGIGLYAAPFKNMKLESLPEAPNATNIVSSGFKDVMNKAGLAGILPASDDVRAGLAQISLMIEAQFGKTVYRCMERMMNVIIERLNLKYDWRFHMFGDLATDEKLRLESKKEMQLGILPATLIYNAMMNRSIMEDISWSDAIVNSDLLSKRIPLQTSYTMSAGSNGTTYTRTRTSNPAQTVEETTIEEKKTGRPEGDGTGSEGAENDMDSYGETRFAE